MNPFSVTIQKSGGIGRDLSAALVQLLRISTSLDEELAVEACALGQ